MLDDADFARSMGLAVGSMWLIEETAGNTLAEVRAQERLYADLRAELTRKYQKLADMAAARDFGLSVDATLWKGLSDYLARGGFEVPQYATVLKDAEAQATTQRFFHWDLDFHRRCPVPRSPSLQNSPAGSKLRPTPMLQSC